MKRKPMLFGGLGVIALVVVYFAVLNPGAKDEDLQGAITAAKVHRTDQITDADVVLVDPEIQDLLQSDFFNKLVTDPEFRQVAVDQLSRLDMATQRHASLTSATSLADMKLFLDLAAGNTELKQALADGRMNVVREILTADGKLALMEVANRIFMTQGRHPQLNLTALGDMKMFLDSVMLDANLKNALSDGRMDLVSQALVRDGKANLEDAAQRVVLAESRQVLSTNAAVLADMRSLLQLASSHTDLRQALAEGRMDAVSEMLVKDGRANLQDAANRIYLSLGKGPQLTMTEFTDMKLVLDIAISNGQMRAAMTDGRMSAINEILVRDGKANLQDAANRVFLAQGRHPQLTNTALADMKLCLDFAAANADLKAALADGRMDLVSDILVKDGKANLQDAANRIYATQGRSPQLNAAALGDMRLFLTEALGNASLKAALADGRMDLVNEALVKDGKASLQDAAQRVYLTEGRHAQLGNAPSLNDMRAIADFAAANGDFANALQNGDLDAAARVALAAGKHDLSLRNLQVASWVVGSNRNFVPELNRLTVVAESPAYRMAADQPGFNRLVAHSDAVAWRQTMDDITSGKMARQDL